ncbi:MAG: hypothetical protein K6C05_01540 [Anaerovibrio sp.]|uniref:hypothetical protein n=1 Tax=Anaerovibrio sp. TaxID=1872532 RepID=UPI0025EAE868|nr:hypothetical protein [Anaerovibrio sp.]MCR5175513.1 hypothetical protein [Anaerovibrio sp.]
MNSYAEDKRQQPGVKHYLFLLVWWLSLGYTLDSNSAVAGLVLCFLFFAVTAMKVLRKSILIMLAVFVVTAIFPALGLVVGILALIFFLMRIGFVINNWRALVTGIYAYGIYLIIVLFNAFFYETVVVQATLRIVDFFNAGGETAVETFGQQGVDTVNAAAAFARDALHVGSYVFPLFLAMGFHRMLMWLYRHGYTTTRAFHVIGLTPLVILAMILPFLKIDLGGDEIFAGSLSDGTDDVPGIDGVNNSLSLPRTELPEQFTTLMDVAEVDVAGWFTDHAAGFSPAIEASVAAMAVRGIYALSDENSSIKAMFGDIIQHVTRDKDNNIVINDQQGKPVARIIRDEARDRERAVFENGEEYILDRKTGDILGARGNKMARIKETANGGRMVVTNDNKVLRVYDCDGVVKNTLGQTIGQVLMTG